MQRNRYIGGDSKPSPGWYSLEMSYKGITLDSRSRRQKGILVDLYKMYFVVTLPITSKTETKSKTEWSQVASSLSIERTANWILRNMDFAKLRNMDSAK